MTAQTSNKNTKWWITLILAIGIPLLGFVLNSNANVAVNATKIEALEQRDSEHREEFKEAREERKEIMRMIRGLDK